ncbi:MAG TPA: hypothetical protein VGH81_02765 [Rudaea sp.]
MAAYVFFRTQSVDFIARNHDATAEEYSHFHRLTLPARLRFGSGKSDMQYLGDGWHLPESDGVWSSGRDASVELDLQGPMTGVVLRLGVSLYGSPKSPNNRLRLSVNGKTVAWLPIAGQESGIDVPIPHDLINRGTLHLQLHVDHCESPLRERTGSDPRRLGVMLEWIDILRLDGNGATDAVSSLEKAK